MDDKAIVVHEKMGAARPINIENLLQSATQMGKEGVEVMERLMVIRREMNAERAKESFFAAMQSFQNACPPITKLKSGAKDAYKYAPLDAIIAIVKPLLMEQGFSYSITGEIDQGWVKAICTVTHRDGHSERSQFKVPIDARNPMMNDPQRYGASMTFAKRYAIVNAFGILTADADLDGHSNLQKPAGPSTLHGDKAPSKDDAANKRKLVDLTRNIHFCKGYALTDDGKMKLTQFLIDEAIISDTQTVVDLEGAALSEAVSKVERKLL